MESERDIKPVDITYIQLFRNILVMTLGVKPLKGLINKITISMCMMRTMQYG